MTPFPESQRYVDSHDAVPVVLLEATVRDSLSTKAFLFCTSLNPEGRWACPSKHRYAARLFCSSNYKQIKALQGYLSTSGSGGHGTNTLQLSYMSESAKRDGLAALPCCDEDPVKEDSSPVESKCSNPEKVGNCPQMSPLFLVSIS
jgi:hypothetical protein